MLNDLADTMLQIKTTALTRALQVLMPRLLLVTASLCHVWNEEKGVNNHDGMHRCPFCKTLDLKSG